MRRAFVMAAFAVSSLAACAPEPVAPNLPEPAEPLVEYVTRQEILTPLPLRVRLPSRFGAEKVLVFFHTWGSRDWGIVELARAGQTWSGEVGCREVSTVTGDTRYFFVALDGNGEAIGGSGSPSWPHVATIVGSLPEGPRTIDGAGPIFRCHDPADCPPDFPGCPAYAWRRPACSASHACSGDAVCSWDGYCTAPEAPPDAFVNEDAQLAAAVKKALRRYQVATNTRR